MEARSMMRLTAAILTAVNPTPKLASDVPRTRSKASDRSPYRNTTHGRDYVKDPKSHPRRRHCVKILNPTHGSGWMVQVQPTRRAPRPSRYYSLHSFSSRLRGKE